jgi:ketosteroid isomerase-like protein
MLLSTKDLDPRHSPRAQNVDVVRQSIEAYGCRDLDALRRSLSADVELDWSASNGWLAGVYRGSEKVMGVFADYFSAFETIVIEPEAYIPSGDSVVVPNLARHRGREGIEVSARATFVYTVQGEVITRICLHQELADALEAMDLAA